MQVFLSVNDITGDGVGDWRSRFGERVVTFFDVTEEHAAQWKDVDRNIAPNGVSLLFAFAFQLQEFRGAVYPGAPGTAARHREASGRPEGFAETEIGHFQDARRWNEHILRLDVPVDESFGVDVLDAAGHLM